MKSFLKNVLANIVAILIIFFFFVFLFIMTLVIGTISSERKLSIKENTVLVLDYKTQIIDSPTEDQQDTFYFNKEGDMVLIYDLLLAIKNAKSDPKIKGISIESDFIESGITQLDDVREALEDFKKSGKFVYAYGNTVSQPSYYLGSVANQYFLNPVGSIELKGMSVEVTFFKNFAEKYGIGTQVIRHGKYKAAVEPFLSNEISNENKNQLNTLLNDIWSKTSSKICISRKIDSLEFKKTVDSLYGIIPEQSVQYKLVDKLVQKSEYDQILKSKLNIKKEETLNKISFANYLKSFETPSYGEKIAVLYASGSIYDGSGFQDIYAKNFIKEINELANDKEVKAVVLRVNSPGGSGNASDQILFELQQLKTKKPLIVSFGDYAASGGYYIAMGADKIYSEPNTVTGSIGVFGMIPNVKDLANKNGIRSDAVSTNANSAIYSPINGLSAGAVTMMTKNVEQTYKRFVYFVTQNRKKSFQQIDEMGGGRVWSGARAQQLGLVDELGNLNDAISFAGKKAGLKTYSVQSYPAKVSWFEQMMSSGDENAISTKIIQKKLGKENYKVFEQIVQPKIRKGIFMESPYSVNLQ